MIKANPPARRTSSIHTLGSILATNTGKIPNILHILIFNLNSACSIYTLSEEEKAKWAGKLQDKQIVIGVRELNPFGGRLRARGAIVTGPDGKN